MHGCSHGSVAWSLECLCRLSKASTEFVPFYHNIDLRPVADFVDDT